ncbi:alpha,alpha-trehalase nth1 [Gaertneriomyces sp. JEL0708]|nr:alpha,alpha-trehalase nth1 [Gaertneriomyces sp. JEL0708]
MSADASALNYMNSSKRDRFLKDHAAPKKKVENIHIEEELFYHDRDHAVAHGEDGENVKLQRGRTLSITSLLDNAKDDTDAKPLRHRRGSHDEKLPRSRRFLINVETTQRQILEQEDTDGDFQITVQDTGPKTFILGTANSSGYRKYEIRGTYALSNLLQELALASDYGRKFIVLDEERLNENPVERLSRLIKYHFWDGLTRRIDAEGLEIICNDPKNRSKDQRPRVYVPYHDDMAMEYYTQVAQERKHLNLDVVRLPEIISPQYVKSINHHPGILSLGLRRKEENGKVVIRGTPFVVPGGRFNEMYGWDSYFESLGLLLDGRVELARGMVENFCYEIEHYGKILNANRSYYLTRSQPPFLTDMINKTLPYLHRKGWTMTEGLVWTARSVRASIKELLSVWLASPRLDYATGLCKYHPEGMGMPPETEASHFLHIFEPYAKTMGIELDTVMDLYDKEVMHRYANGTEAQGEAQQLEAKMSRDEVGRMVKELNQYFVHDRAVRESGHDTTYRFEKRCANLATIDLASLVYKYEIDLSQFISTQFGGVFKLRVRKGPDDIYLNEFLEWVQVLKDQGVEGSVGNGDTGRKGFDGHWAKGIMVYDEPMDEEWKVFAESETALALEPGVEAQGGEHNGQVPKYHVPEGSYFDVYFTPELFDALKTRHRHLIDKYLWNEERGMFFDYDCHDREMSVYETVTCLWALWAGCCSKEQAERMVPAALKEFEVFGGLVSGTESSRGVISIDRPNRQWDFPYGWAPHQILAWPGMVDYGFENDARRVCYRWLYTITKAFVDFNGVVPEKFDVWGMTHKVEVEYGNVGADFRCVVREGFGWMNASFQLGLTFLTKKMRRALGALTPPEQLFKPNGEERKIAI